MSNGIPNRNVFVKGFGNTLDKKKLRVYFRDHIGDVESADVVTDDHGISLGYGYVSFYHHQDAVEAVHKISGRTVNGKTLVVEFFMPKQKRRPSPICNVYVKGFQEILDDHDLKDLFEIFGEIQSAKVERHINGTSKCYGYVCFKNWQNAEAAIMIMNGYQMGSYVLTVCPFQSKEERQKDLKNRNLHIKNLHESINDDELRIMFQRYGTVLSSVISPCPFKGVNQGYVCFETAEEADNAISALNLCCYKGFRLQVCVHLPKESRMNRTNDMNFRNPERQNQGCPELSKMPCIPKAKENLYKSKSLGNLKRWNGKSRITAKFTQNQSPKNARKDTNGMCSDGKCSLENSMKQMEIQDSKQSTSVGRQSFQIKNSLPRTKEKACGESITKTKSKAS